MLKIGEKAPGFSILNDANQPVSLTDFLGKTVILYFYPKDDTPGCTTEACDFRDAFIQFSNADVVVLGVSKDNVKSHQKFKEKYKLPFPLLSDETREICEKYEVLAEKSRYGKKYIGIDRSTFLIDPQGAIQGIWRGVKAQGHVEELLGVVKR
jgi:thioredoxin-dependent peroxiredoxin